MASQGKMWRALHRMAAPEQEREAADLQRDARQVGATPVSQCPGQSTVCIAGTLRSVRLAPVAGTPALEADLYDGSGTVRLVFLGRRRIAGIDAGRSLLARGRITTRDGKATMFNPHYQLLPTPS